jgi:hypothetical protein
MMDRNVARKGETSNACIILVRKPLGENLLEE